MYGVYVLMCLDGQFSGRPSDSASCCLDIQDCGYLGDRLEGWLLDCESGCSLYCLERYVVAAWRSVKSVMNTIIWVAVQVADFLSRRMFLTKTDLAFGWMGSGALRGACLLAVVYVG